MFRSGLLLLLYSALGQAATIFQGVLIASVGTPAPQVNNVGESPRPVRPLAIGGISHVTQLFPVLMPGEQPAWPLTFNTGNGALEITIEDLGPLVCDAPQCAQGLQFSGNVYEAVLDGASVGAAPMVGNALLPLAFLPGLPAGLIVAPVTAGQHTLDFDNLTLTYYGTGLNWPEGGGPVPAFNTDTAFAVTVTFVPEPASGALALIGVVLLAVRAIDKRSRSSRLTA